MRPVKILLLIAAITTGCASKRNAQQSSGHIARDSTIIEVVDSTQTTTSQEIKTDIAEEIKESEYTKTTIFDDSGKISQIVERIIIRDLNRIDLSHKFERKEWLTGMSSVTTTDKKEETRKETSEKTQKDSRPIKGFEWILFAIALAIFFVLYQFGKKRLIR